MSGRLGVVVDGAAMPDEEARAFWSRFSAYMEANKGDLAGFARQEGLASVHPEMHGGVATLVGSRSAPQRAYANAPQHPQAGPKGEEHMDRGRSHGPERIHGGGRKKSKKR